MKRPALTLTDATALVTGAGSGIGRATAHALAAGGATVLCTDIDEAAAEKTAAECGERASAGQPRPPIGPTTSTWPTGPRSTPWRRPWSASTAP